jgi:hypothetical protein
MKPLRLYLVPILIMPWALSASCVNSGAATAVEAPLQATATAVLPQPVPFDSGAPVNPNPPGYPANWWLGQLAFVPSPARVGQAVQVWANIYMTDIPMSFINAYLEVNGQVVARQRLVVVFDDSTPFSFTFTPDKPGAYELAVSAILAENEASPDPEVVGLTASVSGRLIVSG